MKYRTCLGLYAECIEISMHSNCARVFREEEQHISNLYLNYPSFRTPPFLHHCSASAFSFKEYTKIHPTSRPSRPCPSSCSYRIQIFLFRIPQYSRDPVLIVAIGLEMVESVDLLMDFGMRLVWLVWTEVRRELTKLGISSRIWGPGRRAMWPNL